MLPHFQADPSNDGLLAKLINLILLTCKFSEEGSQNIKRNT